MSVSWTEKPVTACGAGDAFNASEAVAQATLRQVRALTREPATYDAPFRDAGGAAAGWEALNAQVRALREHEPAPMIRCDCCGADSPLDEAVIGADDEAYCAACVAAPLLAEEN